MQPLAHDPDAVRIGSQVVGNGVRGVAAGSATATAVTTLLPAGCDEVSVQAAVAFASEGVATLVINAHAQDELSRVGSAYVEASAIYAAVDESGAHALA